MAAGKKPRGRPAHTPTDRDRLQVKTMAAMGLSDEEIARIVGISVPTLRLYYHQEIELGAPEANAKVAQSLYKMATHSEKPNVAAAIFWMKARAGWRDGGHEDSPGGKKAVALQNAATAHKGTEWDQLLGATSQ